MFLYLTGLDICAVYNDIIQPDSPNFLNFCICKDSTHKSRKCAIIGRLLGMEHIIFKLIMNPSKSCLYPRSTFNFLQSKNSFFPQLKSVAMKKVIIYFYYLITKTFFFFVPKYSSKWLALLLYPSDSPTLCVLKPKSICITYACKLLLDNGSEQLARSISRLKHSTNI